ncbi:MAG: hypothetical protein IKM23_03405, partial [Bacteroidales bacterium]|nr:hypothetical protein [Bacteroidales bacterium]
MKRIFLTIAIAVGLISCGNNSQHIDGHEHQHSESCNHHDHDHHDHDNNHNHDTDHSHSQNHSQNHSHHHDHGDDAITFSVEQQNKIDFEVVETVSEPLYQIIRTSAQIVPSQEGEKILTATTSGIVSFENKDIVPG